MKFIITGLLGRAPIPPQNAETLFQGARQWFDTRTASGKVDCHYVFPEGGGFAITNANSIEEVLSSLVDYPLYPFMTWEVKPLCDWKHAYDKYIELYKKLAK